MDPSIKDYFKRLDANTNAVKSYIAKLDALVVWRPGLEKRISETGVAAAALRQGRASPSVTQNEEGIDSAISPATTTPSDAPVMPHSFLAVVVLALSSITSVVLCAHDGKFVDSINTTSPPTVIQEVCDTTAEENQVVATEAQAADIATHDADILDAPLISLAVCTVEFVHVVAFSTLSLLLDDVPQSGALSHVRHST